MRWSSNASAKRRGCYPADFAVNTVDDGIKAIFRLPRGNQGALHLFLFGSVARDETNGDSDVDIFIDRDPAKNFGLIELTGIGFLLEDVLGTSVDFGTRGGLHPAIRAEVEREAIQVF